jgi:hypothetical protein
MSKVDVLRVRPLDFENRHSILTNSQTSFSNTLILPETTPWDGQDHQVNIGDNLPILHTGPTGYHLAKGIQHAAEAAASNEPDAEQAFFVADLSKVYQQFLRWKYCLPDIEPYYGAKAQSL